MCKVSANNWFRLSWVGGSDGTLLLASPDDVMDAGNFHVRCMTGGATSESHLFQQSIKKNFELFSFLFILLKYYNSAVLAFSVRTVLPERFSVKVTASGSTPGGTSSPSYKNRHIPCYCCLNITPYLVVL